MESTASELLFLARQAPPSARVGRKVFLSEICDVATDGEMLIRLMRAGEIRLARADFVAAMDPELVAKSELRYQNATYHFLVLD